MIKYSGLDLESLTHAILASRPTEPIVLYQFIFHTSLVQIANMALVVATETEARVLVCTWILHTQCLMYSANYIAIFGLPEMHKVSRPI